MIRKLIGVAITIIALCACSSDVPEPVVFPVVGVKNSVKVGDMIIAGQPTEEGLKQLSGLGYKSVVSARGVDEVDWDEAAAVNTLGMRYFSVPMGKPLVAITDDQVAQFNEAMQNAAKPVVLHCGSGNRAAALWAVWLVEHQGMDADKALKLAEEAGMRSMRSLAEKRLAEPR